MHFRCFILTLIIPAACSRSSLEMVHHRHHHHDAGYGGVPSMIPPASPDCWLETVQEHTTSGELDIAACSYLDARRQQLLSLKLTKCHLESLGRPLVDSHDKTKKNEDSSTNNNKCTNIHSESVTECLQQLSDVSATTYTLFFKDIHHICTRLLQENVANHFYQTSHQLAKISKLAEGRLQTLLEQQEHAAHAWGERQENMTNWIQTQSEKATKTTLQLQEKMQKLRHDEMENYRNELHVLSETVKKTRQSIQPWTRGVDFWIAHATTCYSVFRVLLKSCGTILVLLFLTFPRRLCWMRFRLIFTIVVGVFAKIVLLVLDFEDWFSRDEQTKLSAHLETCFSSLLLAVYVGGVFSSVFCSRRHQKNEQLPSTGLEGNRRQEELLDRLNEMLSQQQQQQQQHMVSEAENPIFSHQDKVHASSSEVFVPPQFSPHLVPPTPTMAAYNFQVVPAQSWIPMPEPLQQQEAPDNDASHGYHYHCYDEFGQPNEDLDAPPTEEGLDSGMNHDSKEKQGGNTKKRSASDNSDEDENAMEDPRLKRRRTA